MVSISVVIESNQVEQAFYLWDRWIIITRNKRRCATAPLLVGGGGVGGSTKKYRTVSVALAKIPRDQWSIYGISALIPYYQFT